MILFHYQKIRNIEVWFRTICNLSAPHRLWVLENEVIERTSGHKGEEITERWRNLHNERMM
jgi:hypothetical protein